MYPAPQPAQPVQHVPGQATTVQQPLQSIQYAPGQATTVQQPAQSVQFAPGQATTVQQPAQSVQFAPGQAMTVQQPLQPGGPTVLIAPVSNIRENYAVKQALILGATQIMIGILSIIFQIVAICVYAALAVVGAGIWCGIMVGDNEQCTLVVALLVI